MKIVYTLEEADAKGVVEEMVKYDPNYGRVKLVGGLIVPFVLLWMLWIWPQKTVFDIIIVVIAIVAGMWVYFKVMDWLFLRRDKKFLESWQKNWILGKAITLELLPDKLVAQVGEQRAMAFDLRQLKSLVDMPKYVLIYFKSGTFLPIPKERVKEGDLKAFVEELRGYLKC